MSEVKCITCKGEKTLTFEQGQRRVPCVTCSGSGIDWRKSYDAALSQLAALREELATLHDQHAEQSCVFCNNSGELLTEVKSLKQRLADAERRNAELEARSNLTNDELIAIARNAALNSVHRYNYMPCLAEDAYKWTPHYWVIEAMRAALNPNPEAASHDE